MINIVFELIVLLAGCFLISLAINALIVPSHLLSAGVTGISILFYRLFGWSVGLQYLIYNIPILILGLRFIGKKFSVYTIISVVVTTIFLQFIPIKPLWTEDPLLSAIFGGVLSGIGGAMLLRVGGSGGGLDIIARVIAKYFNIPIGKFALIINSIIVLCSVYVFSTQIAMYTLISIFTGAKTYQSLLSHVERISVLIVTDKDEAISTAITKSMKRGVTKWHAEGVYTKDEKSVLFCVIVNVQWSDLVQIIKKEDPDAFISVLPTSNVQGNFRQVW